MITSRNRGRAPTGYDGTSGPATTLIAASGHGPGGGGGPGAGRGVELLVVVGLTVTDPRGSFGPGLDGGAEPRVDVPPPLTDDRTDALAVPSTGC
ncbi:hypothetical protein [Actinophytocola sp.]|uniref:hypothetical protein n=1 Tax=Actinophytocola sp. TaxID=1872138 RepID=UPI00389B24C4